VAFEHTRFLVTALFAYGVLSLTHIGLQLTLAVIHNLRFASFARRHPLPPTTAEWPSVSVIVPSYNESADELRSCLESILAQDYAQLQAICVDDGSTRLTRELRELYASMGERGVEVLMLPENVGKRRAQVAALQAATGEIIVTVDSDTSLADPAAIRKLVRGFTDERVVAVTGTTAAKNYARNLLTRLIGLRYWTAFNQERAAQSLFGVVMCCSGPFSAYRSSFFRRVQRPYISQRFMGSQCTFGDDRHLTNLALRDGWTVKFVPEAQAETVVPERIRPYWRQQVRWSKSFYREMVWTVRHVRRRNLYLWYDLAVQTMLPFLLVGAMSLLVLQAFGKPLVLGQYLLVMTAIGLLRTGYGIICMRRPGFVLFCAFGFLYIMMLTPCRLYAIASMRNTGWGTR
jgi:hyaluronan synthase/N-acetylglucosaminyltransferase